MHICAFTFINARALRRTVCGGGGPNMLTFIKFKAVDKGGLWGGGGGGGGGGARAPPKFSLRKSIKMLIVFCIIRINYLQL